MTKATDFLGKTVDVIFDRSLGMRHPKHHYFYKVNYGYIPGTMSPDGEELDAYYLGTDKPLEKINGVCIAVIHRTNEDDDKLIIVPEGSSFSDEEIEKQIEFQEKYFKHIIMRP